MTIIDISQKIGINRNSVAKYLDVLLISGQVEMHAVGTAKLYFLSKRVPISAMLSLSSDYIIVFDSALTIQYINQKVLDFEGITREEALGIHIDNISLSLLRDEEILEKIRDVDLERQFCKDVSISHEDGEYYFKAKIIPTIFEGGTRGISVILEDNTPQKRYELSLEEQKSLYQEMVEDQTELISRWLPDGTHIYVNDAYCRYFLREKDKIIGKRFKPGVHPDDCPLLTKHLRSLTRVTPVASIEQRIIMPDGSVRWQQFTDRAFFDENDNITEYLSVGRDITNRKILERREKETLADLKYLSETSIKFVSMFHEEDIFRYIGESIRLLLPDSNVAIIKIQEQSLQGVVGACFGSEKLQHVVGETFELEESYADLAYSRTLTEILVPRIRALIKKSDKESPLPRIDKVAPPKRRFTMNILQKDGSLCNLLISIPVTSSLRKVELLETIINQASVALRRCRAEKELWIKESAIMSSIDGIMICDRNAAITYVNTSFLNMFGYSEPAEVQGRSLFSFILQGKTLEKGMDLFWQKGGWKGERTGIRKDGSHFYVHISGSAVDDQRCSPQCLLVSLVDITKRKQTEMSRAFLAPIAEWSEKAIIGITLEKEIISWNPAAVKYLGYTEEEILGSTFSVLVPPNNTEIDDIFSRMNEGQTIRSDTIILRRKDGYLGSFSVTFTPVRDYKGHIYGISIMGSDISKEIPLKEKLDHVQTLQKTMEENVPVPLLKVVGNEVTYVNPCLLHLFEKADPKSFIGKNIHDVVTFRRDLGSHGNGANAPPGSVERQMATIELNDGSEKEVAATIFRDYIGQGVWIFFENSSRSSEYDTLLKEIEEKLRKDLIKAIEVIGVELGSKNRVEEELKNEIALHRELENNILGCVFLLDQNSNLVHMNSALAETAGVMPEDAIGKPLDSALNGFITKGIFEDEAKDVLLGSEVVVHHDAVVGDDRNSWKTRLIPLIVEPGQLRGIVGISQKAPLLRNEN
ncbi:PAS domain-containing protein [Methanogenium sp. S4BF]|uniref:PAS domain-containing protein n=1 Tax=Methanogenium sp. S4BF TaxID=1789226 RepID=UPI002416668B|nr:PAS domain-containing protein [Methanogenium sp. S4BF]WFN34519.1 PAS domain-containing protein [Methanogenium sp. S4BF]